MNCWECNRPAHGICKFCGRALCKDHVKERLHVVSMINDKADAKKALVTKKVLFCGMCQPIGELIHFSEQEL